MGVGPGLFQSRLTAYNWAQNSRILVGEEGEGLDGG